MFFSVFGGSQFASLYEAEATARLKAAGSCYCAAESSGQLQAAAG